MTQQSLPGSPQPPEAGRAGFGLCWGENLLHEGSWMSLKYSPRLSAWNATVSAALRLWLSHGSYLRGKAYWTPVRQPFFRWNLSLFYASVLKAPKTRKNIQSWVSPQHFSFLSFFLFFFFNRKEVHNLFLLVFTHNIYRIYLSVLNDLKTKQLFPGALLGCCYSLWFPSPEGSLGHSACILAALYCADGGAS